ncbi:MAG: lipoyl synthase [Desulfarculaceae bacterium]|nr:lipoyl synthase [Desulfarculaceae bacterium]
MSERIESEARPVICLDLSRTDYQKALDLQHDLVRARQERVTDHDRLIVTDHQPVFTLGKRGGRENLIRSDEFLSRHGVDVIQTSRGGNITYHGPGQLVFYPIFDLDRMRMGVEEFVSRLEGIMLDTAAEFGIQAERSAKNPGIWVKNAKIGSIGICIRKGISFHGIALNVTNDLTPFTWINPCGMNDISMTSIEEQLQKHGEQTDQNLFSKVKKTMRRKFENAFHVNALHFDENLMPGISMEVKKRGKPSWLKRRLPRGGGFEKVRTLISETELNTVCQGADCPNKWECFSNGTSTFMILGARCTRNCRFCNVPSGAYGPPDPEEPERVARAAAELNLNYVVVTSVTRDDLPDGGAGHFAETISRIRKTMGPQTSVEVLIPDFKGRKENLETVLAMKPTVLNHNIETVASIYRKARPEAEYERSLELFRNAVETDPCIPVKSGIMAGLGETFAELHTTMQDLYDYGCRILTLGQYLQPTRRHLPVEKYYTPEEFEELEHAALEIGFTRVASGPLVRSSYKAHALADITEGRS